MKILKVSMQNINSLKGFNEIDFENSFENSGIFAITGATGAGKTTILDAICASMYGKTPRLSNLQELMSKHTGDFFCETEFEIKAERYKSRYSLRRSRGKADGKFQPPKMEIAKSNGEIIENSISKVPKKIEEITGLDFNRFTRSILLAQGNFDAFLKANESTKAELLEKMTGTDIYAKLSQKVFEKHKEKDINLKYLKERLKEVEILSQEEIENLNENKILTEKKRTKCKEKISHLRETLSYLKRVEELENKIKNLQKEKTDFEKKEKTEKNNLSILQNALRAKEIKGDYEKYKESLKYLDELSKEIKDTQKEIDYLLKESAENKKIYEETKTKEENFIKVFDEESKKITQALMIEQNIEEKKRQIDKTVQKAKIPLDKNKERLIPFIKNEIDKNKDDILKLDQILDKTEKIIQQSKTEIQNIQSVFSPSLLFTLREKREEINERGSNLKILKEKLIDIENIDLSLEKNKKQKELSDIKLKELKKETEHYKSLIQQQKKLITELEEKIRLEEKIINLEEERKNLKEHTPCPLCGSLSHPWANQNPPDTSRTKKSLKEEKAQFEKNQKRLNELKTQAAKKESDIENISKNTKELLQKKDNLLKAVKEIDSSFKNSDAVEKILKQLREELKEIIKKIKELESDENRLNELQKTVSKQKEKQSKTNLEKEKIKHHLNSLSDAQKELQEEIEEIKSMEKRRFDLIKEKDLKLYEKNLKFQKDKLHHDISKIQDTITDIQKNLNSKETTLKENEKRIEKEKKKNEKLKTLFLEKLHNNNIKDQKEFESFLLDEKKIQTLQERKKRLEEEKTRIEITLKNTQEELKRQKRTTDKPIEEIENSLKVNEYEYEKLTEEFAKTKAKIEQDKKERQKALRYQKEYEEAKEEFRNYDILNHLIGSKDGNKFRKFAQGLTLEYLINTANLHLKKLNERYRLQRSKNSKDKLDITVIDTYQANTNRSVDTLSGGESFIVSLALALGLCDLVSHKIEIKSLFLDEGFGSLDQETLESVLSALNTIKNSGKMIGIISHVEVLKERIAKQIKVIKLSGGVSKIEII